MRRSLVSILRSFKRNKLFSLLNVISLALGIFCFLVVALFVRDELTHDKWHNNVDNIYQAKVKWGAGDGTFYMFPPYPFAQGIAESSAGVLDAVNIGFSGKVEIKSKQDWIEEDNHYFSSSNLFNIFDFDLQYGDPKTALDEPNSVVISRRIAMKYFDSENPIGETFEIKDRGLVTVTGVLKRIPSNSHLQFEIISSRGGGDETFEGIKNNWKFGGDGIAYLLLQDGFSLEQLSADVESLIAQRTEPNENETYEFQGFGELYLGGMTMRSEDTNLFGGNTKYLYIFSVVGVLILFVACFNYVNLTSARLFTRTKDVVVRKVLGASRKRLITKFIGESMGYAVLSLIVSLIVIEMLLPSINSTIGKQLDIDYVNDPGVLWIPVSITFLVGLLAGLYPAIAASRFNMVSSLKGMTIGSSSNRIRKALIVLQFMICGGLVITTFIIRGQAQFLVNFDLGYNSEDVINLDVFRGGFDGKYATLKTEMERIPGVLGTSGSPLPESFSIFSMPLEIDGEKRTFVPSYAAVDRGFEDYFGIEIVKGRGLSELTDEELKTSVLINESAVENLGLTDPVGFELSPNYKIVGIVKDFHYSSAKYRIRPLMIKYDPKNIRYLHLRFDPSNKDATIAHVERTWSSLNSGKPFEYDLMEGHFDDSYRREYSLLKVFNILTIQLIAVAFLGLFALANFEAKQREKEIGIRKVLGANYVHLIQILGRKFVWLVVIALTLTVPITYHFLNKWLQAFPYQLKLGPDYFLVSIAGVVLLTMLILGVHGYSSSLKNPVKILRNE